MKVGRSTHLYKLGYRHCVKFPYHHIPQWKIATEVLIKHFGHPARRIHFRTGVDGPYIPKFYQDCKQQILDREWFSDTRHWHIDSLGYWIAFRDEQRFNLALLTIGDIQ